MRKFALLATASLFALGFATMATAGTSNYAGTLTVEFDQLGPVAVTGLGVATTNGGAGGTHVSTVTLPGSDVSGSGAVPVTDPVGIAANGLISIRLTATVPSGALGGIGSTSPVGTPLDPAQNTLGINGVLRLCLFLPDCSMNLPLNLASSPGVNQLGVGGTQTIGGSTGTSATQIRVTLNHAPWTILTASANSMGSGVRSQQGFIHGPASASSSVALGTKDNPGILQFVTPSQAVTNITATGMDKMAWISALRVGLVPEPGLLLLLASGVAGIAAIGRSRMRK